MPDKKNNLLCDAAGCTKIAKYTVSVEFRPMANSPAARSVPVLKVCEEHKDTNINDIFPTWETWNKVELNFIASGLLPPKKEYSNVVINEL